MELLAYLSISRDLDDVRDHVELSYGASRPQYIHHNY